MPRLTDLSSGKQLTLNLKGRRSLWRDFWHKIKFWWHRKDLSGVSHALNFRARWYSLKSLGKYLFRKLHAFYQVDHHTPASLSGTLPRALRNDKLELKNRRSFKFTGLFGLGLVLFLLFLLANLGSLAVNSATLKDEVLEQIQSGYQHLEAGYQQVLASQLKLAATDFQNATGAFRQARTQVIQINRGVNLLPFSPLSTGSNLLQAGEKLSEAGNELSVAADTLLQTQNINAALGHFMEASAQLKVAKTNLDQVDLGLIPNKYQPELSKATTLLNEILTNLQTYEAWLPQIKELFGAKLPKRYLIAFLNSSEARPCGGFMGSFAIADFQKGHLEKLEVQDTYSVDWQLWENFQAPVPLQPYMETLHMRDSTFAPELKSCAENINYFYERAYEGSSLSGVILINEQMLEDILKLVGTIEMPEYNLQVTAENFFTLLQVEIESNKQNVTTPKQVLLDLVPKVKDQLFKIDPGQLLQAMQGWIDKRDLQAYFFDKPAQNLAEHFHLSTPFIPSSKSSTPDFLFLSSFSVGGNKSDRYLNDQVTHRSNFLNDGDIEDVLIWKRTDTWNAKIQQAAYTASSKLKRLSYREQQRILYILGAGTNQSVVQVYVPVGSVLTAYHGVKEVGTLTNDLYTIFYFTWEVAAGSSQELILKYRLPFQVQALDETYQFEILKQSGQNPFTFSKELDLGRDYLAEGSSWVKESALLTNRFELVKEFENS